MTPELGIVAALEMESGWINPPDCLVEVSGAGEERARAAARRLLEHGATALVSWGVAGGLDPDLEPGTIILPDVLVHNDEPHLRVDAAWRDRLLVRIRDRVPTSTAPLAHAAKPVAEPEEKKILYRQTGAGVVDMESFAVAGIAHEVGIPVIVVRVVVDAARVRLPEVALTMCDEEGRLKKSAVFRLIFRPGEWSGMLKLGRANGAAAKSMRTVWSIAGPDLACTESRA